MQVAFDPLPDNALFAGVDTHSQSHWLCVLNARGEMLVSQEFPATPDGYEAVYEALMRLGVPAGIGIEGTATYGAGLARAPGKGAPGVGGAEARAEGSRPRVA